MLQDNLRREQRAVMDINCITISKILTPLQAAHYMVNAYPQHCDALALRWGGGEGHEPETAVLCCTCYTQLLADFMCLTPSCAALQQHAGLQPWAGGHGRWGAARRRRGKQWQTRAAELLLTACSAAPPSAHPADPTPLS